MTLEWPGNLYVISVQVDSDTTFEWVKQLRYYWDPDLDNCVVRMSNSMYIYGYEYLGASPRLVITPLTVSTDSEILDLNNLEPVLRSLNSASSEKSLSSI